MNRKLFLLFVVMLAAVVLPARWAAAEPSATSSSFIPGEPNDTFETAIPIDLNYAYNLRGYFLTATDLDFYRIDSPLALGDFYAQIETGYAYDETLMTAEIAVYNAQQTLLGENAACNDPASIGNITVPAGTTYIRVRPCPGALDIDAEYRMEVYGTLQETEPNNTRSTASELNTLFGGIYEGFNTDGSIDPAGDVDFYRFDGRSNQWVRVYLYYGMELTLQAADGAVLAVGQPSENDPDFAILEYRLPNDGSYYLRIRSGTHPVGTGYYHIEFSFSPLGHVAHDVEPNDTPVQAVPAEYNAYISGGVSTTDTVDYYRFHAQAGDRIALPETNPPDTGYLPALYDAALNPIPLSGYTRWATLPATGDYYLAFSIDPPATYSSSYQVELVLLTEGEPNDTIETAIPVVAGQAVEFVSEFPCDEDWYRFQGRAGDVFTNVHPIGSDSNPILLSADGSPLRGIEVLPADGVYFLATAPTNYDGWDGETACNEWDDTLQIGEALWISAAANGLGGNAAIKQGDIVTRKTAANQWQIVFDASDVGITRNVTAFERLPNGSILMSLAAAQTVPGLGKVMPQDIIQFLPTSLGDNTAGTFQWYLDGSDVGLTTSGEKIDAILMFRDIDNPLRISTTGAGSAPKHNGGTLKWADEDIINFVGAAFGANTAGAWRMHLNGSDVPGLAVEDVNAATRVELYPQHESYLLLSMAGGFTISGNAGTPFDVVIGDGWLTAVQRLTDKKIDGLAIGPAWMP